MKIFKNIFRRNTSPRGGQEGVPLRIEGVPPAPMTAEPDNAELAAQALLEMMAEKSEKRKVNSEKFAAATQPSAVSHQTSERPQTSNVHDAMYFKALAERIRQAHDAARLRSMRFVAFCEQELAKADLPLEGPGSLGLLNVELMKRIDTIERVGGELKRRWQHCLAEVTVRLMKTTAHTEPMEQREQTGAGSQSAESWQRKTGGQITE